MIPNKQFLYSNTLLLGIFLVIAWFLFTYKITEVPPGINGDEAHIGYNAKLISMTGYDQTGRFLPIFISNPEGRDWKQPITVYSVALIYKIFGSSYFGLRVVSIIYVLVSSVLLALLLRNILGIKAVFLGLLIFITTPIIMIQAHLALENVAPLPFIILWLFFLNKYQTNKYRLRHLVLSGIFLGISTYSYYGMRLIVPSLTLMTVAYILFLGKKRRSSVLKDIAGFLVPIIVIFILTLMIKDQYPGAVFGNNRPGNLSSYQDFFLPYLANFDPSFLYVTGDITPYHSTGKHGVFLLITLPIFIAGLFQIIRSKNSFLLFIILLFFLSPLLYGLVSSLHRGSRLLALLPFYTIISTVGLSYLIEGAKTILKKTLVLFVIMLILLNYLDFLNDYWYDYPKRVTSDFAKPMHLAFEKAKNEANENKLKPFLEGDFYAENPIAYDFFKTAYFDNQIEDWNLSRELPEGSILIAKPEIYSGLDAKKVKNIDLGTPYFMLFIRENE